jgi:hypothetical protein
MLVLTSSGICGKFGRMATVDRMSKLGGYLNGMAGCRLKACGRPPVMSE